MNILDDLGKIDQMDPEGMLEIEEGFYNQLVQATDIASKADLSRFSKKRFEGIAFLGMGGSGFTGDIVKDLIQDQATLPLEVVKGYSLPAFVKKGWLSVAVSYSGNTEETLNAAGIAMERGVQLLCVCSGGELERLAGSKGYPLLKLPSGIQPRGASAYLFFSTYLVMGRLGIVDINEEEIKKALSLVREKADDYRREVDSSKNFAKIIAKEIGQKIPVIYGTEGILSTIAYRWKCQMNENSKCPSFCNEFPELNHNETVGWQRCKDISKGFVLIVLRDKGSPQRLKLRIDTTIDLIRDNVSKVIKVPVEGDTDLEKALAVMYLGDMASVYLAILNNTDPTPVEKIAKLKAELKKMS